MPESEGLKASERAVRLGRGKARDDAHADAHGAKGTGEKMFDLVVRFRSMVLTHHVLDGGEIR